MPLNMPSGYSRYKKHLAPPLPDGAVDAFLEMVNVIAGQTRPRSVYEHFKRYFAPAAGVTYVGSSSEEWAGSDLRGFMFDAAANSPVFLSAFYDAIEALRSNSTLDLPTLEDVNELCRRARVGFEIHPPDLVPRHVVVSKAITDVMNAMNTAAASLVAKYGEEDRDESADAMPERFDVAITVARPDRKHANQLAEHLRRAGVEVFYDELYPEHLWGRNLIDTFDEIFRLRSTFCVMFISKEYALREWTNYERKSALARALKEKGSSYILPIRIDDTDLAGLPPTVSYMSLDEYTIDQIGDFLIKKLRAAKRRGA
jgi:hypothetical protein